MVGLLAGFLPASASAQSQVLYWDRYDVSLTVEPDGDLQVVETQVIQFVAGTFSRGFAVIPTGQTEGIDGVSVVADGRRLERSYSESPNPFYTSTEDDGDLGVYWFFPSTGPGVHTYELAYTAQGALRIAPDGDKLQWKAIPSDRDFQVLASSVTVHLPEGAKATEAAVTTSYVPVDWQTSADGSTVTFTPAETIPPYQELEIGVVFTHGVVTASPPSWQAAEDRRVEWETRYKPALNLIFGALGLMLLLGAPVLVLVLWASFGRDPEPGPVPEYLSEPPSDMPPGVVGTLLDERADMPDIVATLVDLARRGVIEIEEQALPGAFGSTYREFVFHRKEGQTSRPFEGRLVTSVFGGDSTEQKLSGLRQRFYRHVPRLEGDLYAEAVKAGFFKSSPEAIRNRYQTLGFGLIFVSMVLGVIAVIVGSDYVSTVLCPFGGLVALGFGLLLSSGRMPAKTRAGVEEAAKWRAFKRYLENIERRTDLKAAAGLFERYLPYAIAFGLVRSWVSKFSRVEAVPVPGWYRPYPRPIGMHGVPGQTLAAGTPGGAAQAPSLQGASDRLAGGLQGMSDGLVSMLNTTGQVFGSTPPSSSGTSGHFGGSRSGGGYRGGSFRSGGGGGGGRRGFG